MSDPDRTFESSDQGRGPALLRTGTVRSAQEKIQPVSAPEPPKPGKLPRSKSRFVSTMSALFTTVIVFGVLAAIGVVFGERQFSAPGPLQNDRVVVIPKNTGAGEIAELLQREGVITSPTLFEARMAFQSAKTMMGLAPKDEKLKAGEFLFKQQASLSNVIETLTSGQAITHGLTIPEGLTSEQVVNRIKEAEFLSGEIADIPPEGTLLPTTLKFERGTHRQRVVERLRRDHAQVLKEIWDRRAKDLPVKTPQELVILASIVEKETGKADERPRIAGLFINRLNAKPPMRLQSDPTIIYGIVGGRGAIGRPLLQSEIDQVTAYNTYKINGLPPGPICNPGRAALEAVANPSRTKDLFFVADGTGGHSFAETYEQHQRNVVRWRQIENQSRDPGTGTTTPGAAPPPGFQQKTERLPGPSNSFSAAFPIERSAAVSSFARLPDANQKAPSPYVLPQVKLDERDQPYGASLDTASGANLSSYARGAGERPAADDIIASADSFPVPASRRAGLRASSPGASGAVTGPAFEPVGAGASAPPAVAEAGKLPGATRPRAFDAVEGSKRDPLLNKTFDLSSSKTVPSLR
jgi:UPF0755 protein